MHQGRHGAAVAEANRVAERVEGNGEDACRVLYVRGRSYYKLNQLGNAVRAFRDIGTRWVDTSGEYGPRGLYLAAPAELRRARAPDSAPLTPPPPLRLFLTWEYIRILGFFKISPCCSKQRRVAGLRVFNFLLFYKFLK